MACGMVWLLLRINREEMAIPFTLSFSGAFSEPQNLCTLSYSSWSCHCLNVKCIDFLLFIFFMGTVNSLSCGFSCVFNVYMVKLIAVN